MEQSKTVVELDTDRIVQEHRRFFHSGTTRSVAFRLEQLGRLKDAIVRNERLLFDALLKDLRKSEMEAYATEIGLVLDSIRYTMNNLKRWAKPQKVKTPLFLMPSTSRILSEPYGTVLIISPYNYPVYLCIEPMIGAIAAGNCVVLKPSEMTPNVSAALRHIVTETFDESYVRIVEGEREVTSALLAASFDYIFFTGSVPVGKIVMEAAAKQLIPVTLELGGKSPVIVDSTANLNVAAKRIVWGKLLNAGQTCIAPDYVLVHEDVKDTLISKMKETIAAFYGANPGLSPDFGRIVNERHFHRLAAIIDQDRANVVAGGRVDKADLYIEPTLLSAKSWDDAAMSEEIFGPILPILPFRQLEEAITQIIDRPKPLSLYLFTESKAVEREVLERVSFGGGCVNDTVMHVSSAYMPFGGVGHSGIGGYHGKYSFDLFSHKKSILKKSTRISIELPYPPYKDKMKWLRKLLK
jgi:aldehyde dehydrogenase (NAD+)